MPKFWCNHVPQIISFVYVHTFCAMEWWWWWWCVCVYCLVTFSVTLPEHGKVKLVWPCLNVSLCSLFFSIDLLWLIACDKYAQGVWMQFVSLTSSPFELKKLIFHHSLLLWIYLEFDYTEVSYLSKFFANTTANPAASGQKGHFYNIGSLCIWVTPEGKKK